MKISISVYYFTEVQRVYVLLELLLVHTMWSCDKDISKRYLGGVGGRDIVRYESMLDMIGDKITRCSIIVVVSYVNKVYMYITVQLLGVKLLYVHHYLYNNIGQFNIEQF